MATQAAGDKRFPWSTPPLSFNRLEAWGEAAALAAPFVTPARRALPFRRTGGLDLFSPINAP